MNISEKFSPHFSESYTVKIWVLPKDSQYWHQEEHTLYATSKSAHESIETYIKNRWHQKYQQMRVISITYQ